MSLPNQGLSSEVRKLVKVGNTYQSCCVVVKNMQRCIYAIPNGSMFQTDTVTKFERDVEESKISPTTFRTKLHDMVSGLKTDIAKRLLEQNVSSFSMAPVKRSYALDRPDIPTGENYVLKINYPFKDPPLPSDLKGGTFSALLGTHCSYNGYFVMRFMKEIVEDGSLDFVTKENGLTYTRTN